MPSNCPYWFLLLCILSFILCFPFFLCLTCFLVDIFSSAILLSFIMPSLILLSFLMVSFCMGCAFCCAATGTMIEPTNKVATKIAVVNFLIDILTLPFMIDDIGDSLTAGINSTSEMLFVQHYMNTQTYWIY